MILLREALTRCSWRLLLVIGRRRGLRLSSNAPKAELIDRLDRALVEPANLVTALVILLMLLQREPVFSPTQRLIISIYHSA